jgi:hypothetical protein
MEIVAIPTHTPVSAGFGPGGCVAVAGAANGGETVGGDLGGDVTVSMADQRTPDGSGAACMT